MSYLIRLISNGAHTTNISSSSSSFTSHYNYFFSYIGKYFFFWKIMNIEGHLMHMKWNVIITYNRVLSARHVVVLFSCYMLLFVYICSAKRSIKLIFYENWKRCFRSVVVNYAVDYEAVGSLKRIDGVFIKSGRACFNCQLNLIVRFRAGHWNSVPVGRFCRGLPTLIVDWVAEPDPVALKLHWDRSEVALKMHWKCTENALQMHCKCTENALKMHWNYSECTSGIGAIHSAVEQRLIKYWHMHHEKSRMFVSSCQWFIYSVCVCCVFSHGESILFVWICLTSTNPRKIHRGFAIMVGYSARRVYYLVLCKYTPEKVIKSLSECFKMGFSLWFSPTAALARAANDSSVCCVESAADHNSPRPESVEPGSDNSGHSGSGSVAADASSPAAQSAADSHVRPGSDQPSPAYKYCHHTASSHSTNILHPFDKLATGTLSFLNRELLVFNVDFNFFSPTTKNVGIPQGTIQIQPVKQFYVASVWNHPMIDCVLILSRSRALLSRPACRQV